MKKIIFIVLSLITLNISYSQFKLNYGIKAGLSLAHQVYNGVYTTASSQNRPGVDAGIYIEPSFGKAVSFIGEILYIQKGESNHGLQTLIECISTLVLLKLKTQAGKFMPYLLSGPRFDFILSYDNSFSKYMDMNKINFGLTVGLGCEVNLWKNNSLITEIRYDPDLTFSRYIVTNIEYSVANAYNRSFEFLVGVKF